MKNKPPARHRDAAGKGRGTENAAGNEAQYVERVFAGLSVVLDQRRGDVECADQQAGQEDKFG